MAAKVVVDHAGGDEDSNSSQHSSITSSDGDDRRTTDIKEEPSSDHESGLGSDEEEQLCDGADLLSKEVKQESDERSGSKGMADVMAKILGRRVPENQPAIMAKAKTERQLEEKKRRKASKDQAGDVIVVGLDGEIKVKNEQIGDEEATPAKKRKKRKIPALDLKKAWENLCHVIPDPLDRNRERNLVKIATRGVVQLFNAVRQQQKDIRDKLEEAGPSERRKDKALESFSTGDFLDTLKSQKVTTVVKQSVPDLKDEVKEEPSWSVLKDDFLMGSRTMKDWDKESVSGQGSDSADDSLSSDSQSEGE